MEWQSPEGSVARHWRGIAYVGLEACGFLVTSLLLCWGAFVLFLFLLGGFSLDGVMHQLANMSVRYVAADAQRLRGFRHFLMIAHLAVTLVILILRRARLSEILRAGRSIGHD